MVDKRIEQLPAATTLGSSDLLHISQSGVDKRITSDILVSQLNSGVAFNFQVKEESSTARTLSLSDRTSYIRCLSPDVTTITIPTTTDVPWTLGDQIYIRRQNAKVDFIGSPGVTLNGSVTGTSLLASGQGATLTYIGANTWDLETDGIFEGDEGVVTDYSDVTTYTEVSEWVRYDNIVYRPKASELPIGPEAFDENHWTIAQITGADDLPMLINGDSTTVQGYLQNSEVSDYDEMISNHASSPYPEGSLIQVTDEDLAGTFKVIHSPSHGIVYYKGLTITLDSNYYAERINYNEIIVDWFITDGTRVVDSVAIRAAIYKSEGRVVRGKNKRYYYDGANITYDNVRFYGSGAPKINSGFTALEGGTIIDGSFTFTSQNADFRDFGVDVGSDSDCDDGDCLRASAPTLNAGGWLHTENLVALNKAADTVQHAFLFQSYLKHTGDNLYGAYSLFGFVSKCQNVDLGLITTYHNDESGVILKSDTGFGRCRNVSIQRTFHTCSPNQRRGFHIQSSNDNLRNVQIGQVYSDGALENVLIQIGSSGTDLRNISIDDIYSKNAQTKDLGVENLNGVASIFNVNVGRLVTEGTNIYGIRVTGNGDTDDLNVGSAFINYVPAATQTVLDASCFIGGNCKKSHIGDLTIIRNYITSVIGGITYSDGENGDHFVGSLLGNVMGANRPQAGLSEPSITGTGNSLTVPKNLGGESFSVIRVSTSESGSEVNGLVPPVAGANNFQFGHKLTIINNSLYAIDFLHNPSNGIYNSGGLTVTIPQNEIATWVYGGNDTWFQNQ